MDQSLISLIREVIARSKSLDASAYCGVNLDQEMDSDILISWRKAVGGSEALEKRIQWAQPRLPQHSSVLWESFFSRVLTHPSPTVQSEESSFSQIPFASFFQPFVDVAFADLSVSARRILSSSSHIDLRAGLTSALSRIASRCLLTEFSNFRKHSGATFFANTSHALYKTFIDQQRPSRFKQFFGKYPVLAKILSIVSLQAGHAISEFCDRVDFDAHFLANFLNIQSSVFSITNIRPFLSDPHSGYRTVFIFQVNGAGWLTYKPRSLTTDIAWNKLLQWCNRRFPKPLKLVRSIDRGQYGYAEYLSPEKCESEQDLIAYYQRGGYLLALAWIFGLNDCHSDNIIATRDGPCIVDLETAFQPRVRILDGSNDGEPEWNGNTVLQSRLLPEWESLSVNGIPHDFSGLGFSEREQERLFRYWQDVNTDNMRMVRGTKPDSKADHQATLSGKHGYARDFIPEILRGFDDATAVLCKYRNELLGYEDLWQSISASTSRVLLRPTRAYGVLWENATRPESLTSGIRFSICFEPLCRPLLRANHRASGWQLLENELVSMERADIPIFRVRSSDCEIGSVGSDIVEISEAKGVSEIQLRLSNLSLEVTDQQRTLIKSAFVAADAHVYKTPSDKSDCGGESDSRPSIPVPAMESQVIKIAEQILATSVQSAGQLNWFAMQYDFGTARFSVGPLDYSLYGGRIGVALYLAAITAFLTSIDYRSQVESILNGLIRDQSSTFAGRLSYLSGLGACGVGGVVYGLATISRFLDDQRYAQRARAIAYSIKDSDLEHDRNIDVVGGSAGLILGLVALFKATSDGLVLEKAIKCGHLLQKRYGDHGVNGWDGLFERPLCGFGHGLSGLALAMLRLAEVTGRQDFREIAFESLHFEDSLFDEQLGNWPDFRKENRNEMRILTEWCHGSAGIGMVRAAFTREARCHSFVHSLHRATVATQARDADADYDHLCCGLFGRSELFLYADSILRDRQSISNAIDSIRYASIRGTSGDGFRFMDCGPTELQSPSLYRGTAGVGYQLLRFANPQLVPSVLLWE